MEYGDQEAPAVLIAFEMRGWDGLGKPASAESPDSVVLHFRGYERERKIVAATLKRIA